VSARAIALAAIVAACAVVGAGYAVVAALTAEQTTAAAAPRLSLPPGLDAGGRALLVRAVDYDRPRVDGRLFETGLGHDPDPVTPAGDLACERVHENGRGDGLCLAAKRGGFDFEAVVYGGSARTPRARFAIPGIPDRARVSPDGRYGAFTSFLSGHTYTAGVRTFSVHTAIVDLRAGRELFSLDELEVVDRAGRPIRDSAANLWGVAFAGGDRFYATLGSGGRHHLIAGSIAGRRARVVASGIECPSLSPEGDRIAYKRRLGKSDRWRLAVMDLATGRRTDLAERRSIDDQPEWLGDATVVYSDDRSVWAVPADGGGRPRRLLRGASSPVSIPPGR